jgi:hypothetical protein
MTVYQEKIAPLPAPTEPPDVLAFERTIESLERENDLRGVEDTFGNLANGSLPVAELFRRVAKHQEVVRQNLANDPIGTLIPMSRLSRAAKGTG